MLGGAHPLAGAVAAVGRARLEGKRYEVVAGDRRLRALREIHKGDGDPKIPCMLRDVDAATADAMSLGENFGREAMHPLDEAEAFAKLATRRQQGRQGHRRGIRRAGALRPAANETGDAGRAR